MTFRKPKVALAILILLAIPAMVLAAYRPDIDRSDVLEEYWTAHSRWISWNGLRLHATDRGKGPVVLFIHGSGAEAGAWNAVAEELAGKDFRAIALDLPGSGLSETREGLDYSIDGMMAVVEAAIADLGEKPVAIVGHSTGGQIAWRLALDETDLFERLVLVAPTGQPADSPLVWKLAQVPVLGEAMKQLTPRFMIRSNLEEVFDDDSRVTDALVDRYSDMILQEGARDALLGRMREVSFARHEEIACIGKETLILWGAADTWLSPALGKTFQEEMPNSEFVLVEAVGHDVPEEADPTELARLIAGFVRSAPAEAQPVRGSQCPDPVSEEMARS